MNLPKSASALKRRQNRLCGSHVNRISVPRQRIKAYSPINILFQEWLGCRVSGFVDFRVTLREKAQLIWVHTQAYICTSCPVVSSEASSVLASCMWYVSSCFSCQRLLLRFSEIWVFGPWQGRLAAVQKGGWILFHMALSAEAG